MTTTPTDFESAMAELEQIVRTLEQGDLPLEQSLGLFERGVTLSRFCHERLEDAERRIQVLTEKGSLRDATGQFDGELDRSGS
jgi:exodeoxyribonuclease VII small subunit